VAASNHERIGKALAIFNEGALPFFERELKAAYGEKWQEKALDALDDERSTRIAKLSGKMDWSDTSLLLKVMWNLWNAAFNKTLGHAERSLISELREVRNRWAHQKPFTLDDAYRALDSMQRFLAAVSASDAANEIEQEKQKVLRQRFEEQARRETKKVSEAKLEGKPETGLKSWREIVMPHPDVASGRYQQAEFAADLNQVHRGEGGDEYRDPKEFFRRTFLTEGLRHLLTGALKRLSGTGGDPVVELQTNFGGGKTHSMLALYHLFSGTQASEIAGIEAILKDTGIESLPKPRRAVLVGTALSPGKVQRKSDGTEVRTLWGEMAYQLAGPEGFALVAEADAAGVSPGDNALRELFVMCGPCLVLIDEWVVFVRQLYGVDGLPAGSFDANLSFAQSLTHAARLTPDTLVVASIPSSDIEVGGEGGKAALERLKNTFSRMESAWRPASAEEGFEIVRRRLFQSITDTQKFVERDAVIRAFMELYKGQPGEFPSGCREGDYERRLKAAYPIHPELFDRLYNDWASLDKFQRTRGVLRLMAAVIHTLWEQSDPSLMIMPASIPIAAQSVQFELTRYLDDPWVPVLEKDVDGPNSMPLALDRNNPNLGRYSACRRVARTIYIGSAPTLNTSQRGVEDNRIKLGCVQPGEAVATFGDALRRLTDQATHLYVDGSRYWFSTQPSVTRLAQDRAAQQRDDVVLEEIRKRLKDEANRRGDFMKVHTCPATSGDVPDDRDARLVILDPEYPHAARNADSPARKQAQTFLDTRGTSPRDYRNTLVFLAADKQRLDELCDAVRKLLAWQSISRERTQLNLDAFQENQAKTQTTNADETIKKRIPETFCWLLVPGQPDPKGAAEWEESRLQGDDALAVRASRKLKNDMALVTQYAPTLLRTQLDKIPGMWRGDHVSIKQLCDDFAKYLYLQRIQSCDVLVTAIDNGLGMMTWEQETFAYAEGWDEAKKRYLGLRAGTRPGNISADNSLVVRPGAAMPQWKEQMAPPVLPPVADPTTGEDSPKTGSENIPLPQRAETTAPTIIAKKPKRFTGVASIDATRLGRDAGQIAEAIVQHLAGLVDSELEITIEVNAKVPSGVPDNVVRTVTENCRTLKFKQYGFDEE
jgi:predicted AAA+ superfamily ATPase